MKKFLVWFVAILIMALIVCGCVWMYYRSTADLLDKDTQGDVVSSGEEHTPSDDVEDISDEAIFTLDNYPKVDASLAIHPLVNSLAANFLNMKEEDLDFEYTATRSSEVYRNLIDGKVDVIFAAEISEEDKAYAKEKGVELNIIPATSSAFVFIVNTNNPVNNLSFEDLQKIYTGEITNWKEVGGNDAEIIPFQRPTGSGSQTAMLSLVMKDKKIMDAPTEKIKVNMGELVDAIADFDNTYHSIGYSYFYYINTMYKRDTIKMLAIEGVEPSIETIKSNTYPIFTNGFIVTRSDASDETKLWVDTVLSQRGAKVIEEAGYVPVEGDTM